MTPPREITYLSAPAVVSMADRWYDIASVDHFWIRRRFKVLQVLAGGLVSEARLDVGTAYYSVKSKMRTEKKSRGSTSMRLL